MKFSTDFLTHKGPEFQKEVRACGWWTIKRDKLAKSPADYWVLVLQGFARRSTDFVVVPRRQFLERLAGLTTVARGLADTRRLFGLPSVTESVATWLRRLIVRPGSVLVGAATIEAGSATATATAVLLPGPGATFEQRIQSLERRMAAIETEVACAADRLRQRLATLSDEVSKDRADRTSGDDLRETISQYAVGGLRLERIGLFWLVCGVIATSIPPEIATHL